MWHLKMLGYSVHQHAPQIESVTQSIIHALGDSRWNQHDTSLSSERYCKWLPKTDCFFCGWVCFDYTCSKFTLNIQLYFGLLANISRSIYVSMFELYQHAQNRGASCASLGRIYLKGFPHMLILCFPTLTFQHVSLFLASLPNPPIQCADMWRLVDWELCLAACLPYTTASTQRGCLTFEHACTCENSQTAWTKRQELVLPRTCHPQSWSTPSILRSQETEIIEWPEASRGFWQTWDAHL